jgi:hypothetical protein
VSEYRMLDLAEIERFFLSIFSLAFSVFIIARKAWQVPSPPPSPKFVLPNLGVPLLSIFYYFGKSVKLNFSIRQVYTDVFLVFSAA